MTLWRSEVLLFVTSPGLVLLERELITRAVIALELAWFPPFEFAEVVLN